MILLHKLLNSTETVPHTSGQSHQSICAKDAEAKKNILLCFSNSYAEILHTSNFTLHNLGCNFFVVIDKSCQKTDIETLF